MDQIDTNILKILKLNSRSSNVELARAINLTEGAVRNRIDRLVKTGIITKFTIETSSSAALSAIVMIRAKAETKLMMSEISKSGLAKESYEISGDFDGCVIIEGGSMEELDEKVDKIRKISSVAETKTFISFKRW
ncbi:Lrp/AsnC family transcriptional regulator [Candidatus Micrarchaeota archaeon]|nr:Lrp/AsnC family transcriptional regulator [Candidatus Micrarchaeota archaeon]